MTAASDDPHDSCEAPFAELAPLSPLGGARVAAPPVLGTRERWQARLWALAETLLPLLVLGTLAGFSWWLVRHAPQPMRGTANVASLTVPDVELDAVALRQYDISGREVALIEGRRMRHFAAQGEVRLDRATMHWHDAQGVVHDAQADQAVTDDQTVHVELRGDARVRRADPERPAEMRGENLQFDTRAQLLVAPQGAELRQGTNVVKARTMRYERDRAIVDLVGVRGRIDAEAIAP